MIYEDKKAEQPSNIILENRKKLTVSGVRNVESFDENSVVLCTTKGNLCIKGNNLSIDKLTIDGGELSVEGCIDSLNYTASKVSKNFSWNKLFK